MDIASANEEKIQIAVKFIKSLEIVYIKKTIKHFTKTNLKNKIKNIDFCIKLTGTNIIGRKKKESAKKYDKSLFCIFPFLIIFLCL